MNHLGTVRLETARLTMRRFTLNDAQAMLDNWASDPEVTKFLTWPPHPNVESTRAVIEYWMNLYEKNGNYVWAITLKEAEDNPIGSISVVHSDEAVEKVEIGYCLGRKWWHRGIMSEALAALIEFFFEQIAVNRVEAHHDTRNPHSGDVMKKCGMVYEGTLRRAGKNNQGICDTAIYAIIAGDYFSDDV